jgi:hypothetical protein
MIQITTTGTVQNDTDQNRLGKLKVESLRTYFKNGETVTTTATYYVAVWFKDTQSLSAGETITVTGTDAYRLSEPKADGRVFIDRVISDAQLVTHRAAVVDEELPF